MVWSQEHKKTVDASNSGMAIEVSSICQEVVTKQKDSTLKSAAWEGPTTDCQCHSPGSARHSLPCEPLAQIDPSGAAWNSSTMSDAGSSIPPPAGSQVSPLSEETTIRPS